MAEINKTINGYHIYIGGTWCEVTKNGNHIYGGSVEEGMTAEEVYKQIKEMEEKEAIRKLTYEVNNGGTLEIVQKDHDGTVIVSSAGRADYISNGDMVMLMNWYRLERLSMLKRDIADELYSITVRRYQKENPEVELTNDILDKIWYSIYGKLCREGKEAALQYVKTAELLGQ